MLYLHKLEDIEDEAILLVPNGSDEFLSETFGALSDDLWEYHFDYKRWWEMVNSKEMKHYLRVQKITRHFTQVQFYPFFGIIDFDYAPLSLKPHPDSDDYGFYRLPWPDELWFTSEGTLGDFIFHHPNTDANELNSFFGYSGPMDVGIVLTFFNVSDPSHPSVSDPKGVIKGRVNYINWPVVQVDDLRGQALINNQPSLHREWWVVQPFPHTGNLGREIFNVTTTTETVTDEFLDRDDVKYVVPNFRSMVDARVLDEDEDDTGFEGTYYHHKKVKIISAMLYAGRAVLPLCNPEKKLQGVVFKGPRFGGLGDFRSPDFRSDSLNRHPLYYLSGEDFDNPHPPNPAPPPFPNDLVPVFDGGSFIETIGGKKYQFTVGSRSKLLTQTAVADFPIWVDGDGREQVVQRVENNNPPSLQWKVSLGIPVLKYHDVGEILEF